MIDWNTEIEKAKIRKAELEEKKRLELEAKKLQEQQKKELDFSNYKIFNDVYEEERIGIEALLKSTGHEYQVIIGSGSVEFRKVNRHDGCTGWGSRWFGLEIKEGTDIATYTRQRLAKFITGILLYWDKGDS